jgi:hypothetical protein
MAADPTSMPDSPIPLAYHTPGHDTLHPSFAQVLSGVAAIIAAMVLQAVALWWLAVLVLEWVMIWWVAPLILLGIAGITAMAWSLVDEARRRWKGERDFS